MLKTSLCEEADDELFSLTARDGQEDVPMQDEAINENGRCPTCDPKMRKLATELPNGMHSLTQVACSLTG